MYLENLNDEALDLLASQGDSLACGARFLKRAIDARVKLPISARWREGSLCRVRVRNGGVAVDVTSAEVAAA